MPLNSTQTPLDVCMFLQYWIKADQHKGPFNDKSTTLIRILNYKVFVCRRKPKHGRRCFDSSSSLESVWIGVYQLCTSGVCNLVPALSGYMEIMSEKHFFVKPQILNWIEIWTLVWPLHLYQRRPASPYNRTTNYVQTIMKLNKTVSVKTCILHDFSQDCQNWIA